MNSLCTNTLCDLNKVSQAELTKMIDRGYQKAIALAESHYENFPVISVFIPKELRKHIAVVYQFSRIADDIADEGKFSDEERVKKLDAYWNKLDSCLHGELYDDFWAALNNSVTIYNLSHQNFYNLLLAFKQDVTKHTFENFNEILDYCSKSANPVGRIILEFFNVRDKKAIVYSDDTCTALQLTNFYQDVSIDIKKERIYIPLDELKEFNVDSNEYLIGNNSGDIKDLFKYQIERTRKLFKNGKQLLPYLPSRLRWQIKWTIKGGTAILDKIENNDYNVISVRPKLTKWEFFKLLFKSI